jgi:transcriptional regulator with XRE-family HTH domain
VGLNQAQVHRYEKGLAEPSMSALKGLALALGVTIDQLVFEEKAAKDLLDALILKHQARRWTGTGQRSLNEEPGRSRAPEITTQ